MDHANVLARGLLYDAPDRDGRRLLRAWGEVVEAAGEVWRRLPQGGPEGDHPPDIMDQLERSARALRQAAGTGAADEPVMEEIGQSLSQAAEIIDRSEILEGRRGKPWSSAQLQDAFAARVSLIHTLYLSAHGASVGLVADEFRGNRTERQRQQTYRVPTDQVRLRVAAVEELAQSFLHGHFPRAFTHRHQPPVEPGRLSAAISAWDVHAQRALARDPRTADLRVVATTMARAASASSRLWVVAAATGDVDPSRHEHELSPAVKGMAQRWGQFSTQWAELHHPHERRDEQLHEASREVLTVFRELTSEQVQRASSASIAHRNDIGTLVRDLHHFHATSVGVGRAFQGAVAAAPLQVNARPAHQMVIDRLDRDGPVIPVDEEPPVSPQALLRRGMVPLPQGLRLHLERQAVRVTDASESVLRAVQVAAGAPAHSQPPGSTGWPEPPGGGWPRMGLESELRSGTAVRTSVASAVAR